MTQGNQHSKLGGNAPFNLISLRGRYSMYAGPNDLLVLCDDSTFVDDYGVGVQLL